MSTQSFTLIVQPCEEFTLPLPRRLKCFVQYLAGQAAGEGTLEVPTERELWLPPETAKADLTVQDWQPDTPIDVTLTTEQGLLLDAYLAQDVDDKGQVVIKLEKKLVRQLQELKDPRDKLKFLDRKGQFLPILDGSCNFENASLYIAPYGKNGIDAIESAFNLTEAQMRENWITNLSVGTGKELAALSALSFSRVALGIDGSFRLIHTYSTGQEPQGWLWILTASASHIVAGLQVEATPDQSRGKIGILLPYPLAEPQAPQESPKRNTVPVAVRDASENDLLSRPDVFSDEPGTYFDPFRNSFRIVGENTFYTILRVDSPEIGGTPSLAPLPPSVWNFRPKLLLLKSNETLPLPEKETPIGMGNDAGPVREPVDQPAPAGAARKPGAAAIADELNIAMETWPSIGQDGPAATSGVAKLQATPTLPGPAQSEPLTRPGGALTPDLLDRIGPAVDKGEIALQKLEMLKLEDVLAHQKPWMLQHSGGRRDLNGANPIEWEGDSNIYQATTIGRGHILEHRVRWRSNGYSLGNILHTLTLAPRQTKRITTISWSRSEESRRREMTSAQDLVENETLRERDYFDAVQSSLREWSRGESRSSTSGGAAGLGFARSGFVIGGGGTHGSSRTSAMQEGAREVAAKEHQSLRDSIRQYGESLRQFQSTVVNEVSQEETVTGISETVRNSNYSHSLTVMYHEILRHIRVDTEVVGARECLFIPFTMRPFTLERILKYRDNLARGLRKKELGWVITHLEDLNKNFVNSTIPDGPRCSHPVRHLMGSLFIQLAIARPPDEENDAFVDEKWKVLQEFIGEPARAIHERLIARQKSERDAAFQKEIAPGLAARWVDTLRLECTRWVPAPVKEQLPVDFTLATRYSYNGIVRVDFTCSAPASTLTRINLERLHLSATRDLPSGSVANIKQVRLQYYTDTFDRTIESLASTNDLVDGLGGHDPNGADVIIPLSPWERINLREVIKHAAGDLLDHLNEHGEYYHKLIWWTMDRDRLYMFLDGFYIPGESRLSIASVVERDPVAILGNTLVFRIAPGAFLGIAGQKTPDELNDFYRPRTPSEPMRISIPTGGLYAQALMDKTPATEEHYGSTDWVLTDREPELETIGPEGLTSRRAEPASTAPTPFQAPIINLQAAPDAPAVSGFNSILQALTSGDSFRDLAQVAGTQAAARAAMETAAGLASEFGAKAVELQRSQQATANAPQKLASISKAREAKLLDEGEAKGLAVKALDEMNTQPSEGGLIKDPAVRQAINDASSRPGTPLEVVRGAETVRVGPIQASATVPVPDGMEPGTDADSVSVPPAAREIVSAAKAVLDANVGIDFTDSTRTKYQHTLKNAVNCPANKAVRKNGEAYGLHTHCNFFVYKFMEKITGRAIGSLEEEGVLPNTRNTPAREFVKFLAASPHYTEIKEDEQSAEQKAFEAAVAGNIVIVGRVPEQAKARGHVAVLLSPFALGAQEYPVLSKAGSSNPPIAQCGNVKEDQSGNKDGFMRLSAGFGPRPCRYFEFNEPVPGTEDFGEDPEGLEWA